VDRGFFSLDEYMWRQTYNVLVAINILCDLNVPNISERSIS